MGYPQVCEAVWLSEGWSMTENGDQITINTDTVVMTINSIADTELIVYFSLPEGPKISNGRIQFPSGYYEFHLE